MAQLYKRKLTAILSADVAGYSRLMGQDEAQTVQTLTAYRNTMAELVKQHRGRVIDSPGDNILAEFVSVVDAVQCAVAAQNEFKARNAELAEDRRMQFRMGVNLGDVIEEEGRIYGDGVNITARLESLADPGGICISKTAFDHIESKLPFGYEYLGELTVKNIARPVGAYKVLMQTRVTCEKGKTKPRRRAADRYNNIVAGALIIVVIIASGLIWYLPSRQTKIEPASIEKMAYPLPEKPSIVVLPFANLSGDPTQEFLSDGITENLINILSALPNYFVIAANSSFAYKGKPTRVQQVAEELGVRYVLEGSVVAAGDRIRITSQLIDALKGFHIWSERYDLELQDLFSLYDDLAKKVLTGIGVKLTGGEDILHYDLPRNIQVLIKMMQGLKYLREFNIDDNNRARAIAEECIALEPDYFGNYLLYGSVHMMDYWLGYGGNPKNSLDTAIQFMEKALGLTAVSKGRVYPVLGNLYAMTKDYGRAIEVGEKGISLVPNGADGHAWLAMSLTMAGRAQEAIPLFEKAMRLNPLPPSFYFLNYGNAYRSLGRLEEAIGMYKKTIALNPNNIFAHIHLAASCAMTGKEEEAHMAAKEVLRINPRFSVGQYRKIASVTDPVERDRYFPALLKAGLPE
jgi:adenylate cyclase